jgi:hypothetical protein
MLRQLQPTAKTRHGLKELRRKLTYNFKKGKINSLLLKIELLKIKRLKNPIGLALNNDLLYIF